MVQIGPHICVFKTHVDAFDTWDATIAEQLQQLANKHSELFPQISMDFEFFSMHSLPVSSCWLQNVNQKIPQRCGHPAFSRV